MGNVVQIMDRSVRVAENIDLETINGDIHMSNGIIHGYRSTVGRNGDMVSVTCLRAALPEDPAFGQPIHRRTITDRHGNKIQPMFKAK